MRYNSTTKIEHDESRTNPQLVSHHNPNDRRQPSKTRGSGDELPKLGPGLALPCHAAMDYICLGSDLFVVILGIIYGVIPAFIVKRKDGQRKRGNLLAKKGGEYGGIWSSEVHMIFCMRAVEFMTLVVWRCHIVELKITRL